MKFGNKTLLALFLFVIFLFTLNGCKHNSIDEDSSFPLTTTIPPTEDTEDAPKELQEAPSAEELEYCEITVYTVGGNGTTPYSQIEAWQAVETAVNQTLGEKLNTHVKNINFFYLEEKLTDDPVEGLAVSTLGELLDLSVAAGDRIDLILGMNNTFYGSRLTSFVQGGYALALEELLPVWAPAVWQTTPAAAWEAATVDGSLYGIPGMNGSTLSGGVVYRSDWARELGLDGIHNFWELETYLSLVKEKGILEYPVGIMSGSDCLFHEYMYEKTDRISFTGNYSVLNELMGKSSDEWWILEDIWQTQEAQDYLMLMKTWREKGFWETPELPVQLGMPNTAADPDLFLTGQSALQLYGAQGYDRGIHDATYSDPFYTGDVKSDPVTLRKQQSDGDSAVAFMGSRSRPYETVKCIAVVPSSAANPERALMFLDFLYRDAETCRMMRYGLEGQDYTLDENGSRVEVVDDPFESGYQPLRNSGFSFYTLPNAADDWAERTAYTTERDSRGTVSPYLSLCSFAPDVEITNGDFVSARKNFWMPALLYGLTDAPLTTLEDYLAEREASGFTAYLQAYIDEAARQH